MFLFPFFTKQPIMILFLSTSLSIFYKYPHNPNLRNIWSFCSFILTCKSELLNKLSSIFIFLYIRFLSKYCSMCFHLCFLLATHFWSYWCHDYHLSEMLFVNFSFDWAVTFLKSTDRSIIKLVLKSVLSIRMSYHNIWFQICSDYYSTFLLILFLLFQSIL